MPRTELSDSTERPTVLVVEDDEQLRVELQEFLQDVGYAVTGAGSVAAAEEALQESFDLLVLDINLPDGSGAQLCARLRPYLRSGIVMFTGRSEKELRIDLLNAGADAYLVKPVDPQELQATLASVLRRVAAGGPGWLGISPAAMPDLWRLDRVQQTLRLASGPWVRLSAVESQLLGILLQSPQQTASRTVLLQALSGNDEPMTNSRLDTLISRLRRKVFLSCKCSLPVRSRYGEGYVFAGHGRVI